MDSWKEGRLDGYVEGWTWMGEWVNSCVGGFVAEEAGFEGTGGDFRRQATYREWFWSALTYLD